MPFQLPPIVTPCGEPTVSAFTHKGPHWFAYACCGCRKSVAGIVLTEGIYEGREPFPPQLIEDVQHLLTREH